MNKNVSELIGNGIFESLRTYNGKIFKFQEHLQRLKQSAKALNLNLPPPSKIKREILKELKKVGPEEAYIRVSFSPNGIPYAKHREKERDLTVIVKPCPVYPEEYYENGVEVLTVPTQRNIPSAVEPRIKSENFLGGILAKIESKGAFEAILLNKDGYITEGTVSNIFIVRELILITPPSYLGVLEGITRRFVMEIAGKIGISVEEKPFTRYNLYNADECFLTNTSMEIMPVKRVDGRIIGNGKPGMLFSGLRKEFKQLIGKGIQLEKRGGMV